MVAADPGGREIAGGFDLRLVPVAAAVWAGALAGLHLKVSALAVVGAAVVGAGVLAGAVGRRCGHRSVGVVAAVAVAAFAAASVAGLARATPVRDGPVAQFAAENTHVRLSGVVVSDPRVRGSVDAEAGPHAGYVLVRVRADEVTALGSGHRVRTPVLVVGRGEPWTRVLPGQRVEMNGRLAPASGDVAAFLRTRGDPELIGEPGRIARATEPLRAGLREAAGTVRGPHRALIPGMVVGDESLLSDELREEMRITGLTHLTAVSGTHVGIVLLTVLGVARLIGVRARALPVAALITLVGFVLLVRPDPSVLRAAVMGSVAVVGILVAGRRRSLPALAAAVIVLVLVDPWLARSVGFALSASATAGIVILVPHWERAMGWLPRPLALAVAVPLAAQVACTPVLLGVFGQFSVASVPANLLAAPAVWPAMVLGLGAAVAAPVYAPLAAVIAWLAGWPAWWIAAVARWLAYQPGSEFEWAQGALGAGIGVAVAVAVVAAMPVVLRRPLLSLLTATVLVTVLLRAVPEAGWPPGGWVLVQCDVGQGDAVVLRAGPRSAVVVDAGPDPLVMRRCLDGLRVKRVPVLILTHYHADHVDGVPGVLAGRDVGLVLASPLAEPEANAAQVADWLDAAGVPLRVASVGDRWDVGAALSFEVLWPRRVIRSGDESDANNASVVVNADVSGVEVLLTGDIEPLAQAALLRAEPELSARVLKVPHHGSRRQDERLFAHVEAELALIGVGDNSHGHPAPEVMDALEEAGAHVRRTDEDGAFAVILRDDGTLAVAPRR